MKQNTKINTKNTKKNTKIKKNTRLGKRTYKKVKNTKTNKNMRKNKKGGGLKRPREEDYGYDDQYDDFLNNTTFINKDDVDGRFRSTRSNNLSVKTVSLGSTDKTNFTSSKAEDYDDLKKFVDGDINDGPQIVSIPVPPYRHAFLVNVLPDKIMISDWRGNEKLKNINRRVQRGQADWNQYYDFIELLEERYPNKLIKFYSVNKELFKIAFDKNGDFGGGGCSEYIYSWVEGVLHEDNTFFSQSNIMNEQRQ